jgi:hypothetical protein
MNHRILAALVAAAALPVAAQVSNVRNEPAQPPAGVKATVAKPESAATPRDRAKAAKARGKQAKRAPREKREPPKKPSAT